MNTQIAVLRPALFTDLTQDQEQRGTIGRLRVAWQRNALDARAWSQEEDVANDSVNELARNEPVNQSTLNEPDRSVNVRSVRGDDGADESAVEIVDHRQVAMPLAKALLVDAQPRNRLSLSAREAASHGALEDAVHLVPAQLQQLDDALLAGLAQGYPGAQPWLAVDIRPHDAYC